MNCYSLTQLQSQLEQIVKVNTDLRRNNSIQRKQSHTLLEEKSELEAQLADKEQQINKITSLVREQEEKQAPQITTAPRPPHPSLEVVRTTFSNDSIEFTLMRTLTTATNIFQSLNLLPQSDN